VNIYRRHSDAEQREGEESPHLFQSCRWSHADRVAGVSAAACCFAIFCIPLLTPSVHAFSKQTREAGAATFHERGCEHCHGVDGIGTDRGPDLSAIGKRWKKDRIERQIREGGGGMPPFGDALQPDEVKNLVDYLSAKRKANKATVAPVAVKPSSDDSGL
jgi:mono/diheme cytochrome c family protein